MIPAPPDAIWEKFEDLSVFSVSFHEETLTRSDGADINDCHHVLKEADWFEKLPALDCFVLERLRRVFAWISPSSSAVGGSLLVQR